MTLLTLFLFLLSLFFGPTIRDLGDARFHVRHTAEKHLRSLGYLSAPALYLLPPSNPEADARMEALRDETADRFPWALLYATCADRLSDDFILTHKELIGRQAALGKEYRFPSSYPGCSDIRIEGRAVIGHMKNPPWHLGTEAGDWRAVLRQLIPDPFTCEDEPCDTR